MKTVNILSIDGGGIRGIIPITILHYLEQVLQKHNPNKHLFEYFDIMGGTSTGGLIVLGLGVPLLTNAQSRTPKYTTKSLLNIYTEKGDLLFTRVNKKWLFAISSIYQYKYSVAFIEDLMEEVYGDASLRDALLPILITSYDCEKMMPKFFKSYPVKLNPGTEDFYIKDVARATSAAPTFFPAAKIKSCPPHNKTYGLVDGGVFANNPAMLTVLEARKMYPEAECFNVLSLGTGYTVKDYDIKDVQSWGVYQWMSPGKDVPLLKIMMSGQSDTVHYTLQSLDNVNYFRFDSLLDNKHAGMDLVSSNNIKYLQKTAIESIKRNKVEIHKCIETLIKTKLHTE